MLNFHFAECFFFSPPPHPQANSKLTGIIYVHEMSQNSWEVNSRGKKRGKEAYNVLLLCIDSLKSSWVLAPALISRLVLFFLVSPCPPGWLSTRPTSPRCPRDAWSLCSTTRPWSVTSPAWQCPTPLCWTRARPPPRPCSSATGRLCG